MASVLPGLDQRAKLCVDAHVDEVPGWGFGTVSSNVYRTADLQRAAGRLERIYADAVDDEAADETLAAIIEQHRSRSEQFKTVPRCCPSV